MQDWKILRRPRQPGSTSAIGFSSKRTDRIQDFGGGSPIPLVATSAARSASSNCAPWTRRLPGDGDTEVRPKLERRRRLPHKQCRAASGQVPFAAKPEAFLRFEVRHSKQEGEPVELVASREPGQFGSGLGYEGRGLTRPALAWRLIASRTPAPAPVVRVSDGLRSWSSNDVQCREATQNTPFTRTTPRRISQLFRY